MKRHLWSSETKKDLFNRLSSDVAPRRPEPDNPEFDVVSIEHFSPLFLTVRYRQLAS